MPIKKQEFYEGAAIHLLVSSGSLREISFERPFILLNQKISIYLKYSTKNAGPWGFTFTQDENIFLAKKKGSLILGLICGSDGIVAIEFSKLQEIGAGKKKSIHIGCQRKHGEYYQISGPDGDLNKKISPSEWTKILK